MKKLYSLIALAFMAMSANAQVTYDFTGIAPAPADGGGIVNPMYGVGNNTDSEYAFQVTAADGTTLPMIKLVAPDGTVYDRIGIHNRGKSFLFRNTKDDVYHGLWSQYKDRYLAILDVHPGDEIKMVLSPNDSNTGFSFDQKDFDEVELGQYGAVSRAELDAYVQAKMDEAGVNTETVTAEQLATWREACKTVSFKIYSELTDAELGGQLLLKSDAGLYIEKLTIIPANGSSTGIQDINLKQESKANDAWYNLYGVKVNKPTTKGIYIHNSKKVVVK